MEFKQYLNESSPAVYREALATLLFITENEDELFALTESELNEGKVNDILGKFGLKIHKSNGLIDYIKNFSVASGKLIMAAIKGDKERVKQIASTLDKADVVDFLLKLDMATMHLVTGPIHFVDAVTGWDLMADLKKVAHGAAQATVATIKSVKDAINYIKTKVETGFAPGKKKKVIISYLAKVDTLATPAIS